MPKPNPSSTRNPHMAAVHALGHPGSPPPQTRWVETSDTPGGAPIVSATVAAPLIVYGPNIPAAVSLAQGAASDLTVTWVFPPIDSTHGAATGFNLRSSPAGAGTWTTVSGVAAPYVLSGLAGGAAFDVQLQATNTAGASAWSVASTLTTAPFAPNAPSVGSVAPLPDGTVTKLTVTWTAPSTDGTHGAATGYTLRFSPAGAGTWTTVPAVSSPYVLTGLTGATAIDVQVRATNAAASPGPWSTTKTAATWGATVALGNWVAASTQVHGASVAPNGGVNLVAVAAPTAVTGGAFAWSSSPSTVPTTGLIAGGADGQTNGWGQWFNAPATPGSYYLWLLAQGAGGTTGALVTGAIAVS